jgi:hypothetical protein
LFDTNFHESFHLFASHQFSQLFDKNNSSILLRPYIFMLCDLLTFGDDGQGERSHAVSAKVQEVMQFTIRPSFLVIPSRQPVK